MTKEDARKRFEEEVNEVSLHQTERLKDYIQENFDDLLQGFLQCFEVCCQKIVDMQKTGGKKAVAYLHFSWLRTKVLEKDYQLRMDAYDKNWYLDPISYIGDYDANGICSLLDEFAAILEERRGKYIQKISAADVKQLVLLESEKYKLAVTELIRAAIQKAAEIPIYQEVLREPQFIVAVGEFRDACELVYKEDDTKKDAIEVKRLLEKKPETGNSYEIFEQLDLSGSDFSHVKWNHCSGKASNFTNSRFHNARMMFCCFHQAVFKTADFTDAGLFGVDFKGAALENVDFKGAKLYQVSFENATLIHVDFTKVASMEGIKMEGTVLIDTAVPPEVG